MKNCPRHVIEHDFRDSVFAPISKSKSVPAVSNFPATFVITAGVSLLSGVLSIKSAVLVEGVVVVVVVVVVISEQLFENLSIHFKKTITCLNSSHGQPVKHFDPHGHFCVFSLKSLEQKL